jgi:hypothetical protein
MSDLCLNYFGGSGGFLVLHLLLLSNRYVNDLNDQLHTVVHDQWKVTDHIKWKNHEIWPNNDKTAALTAFPKLFFYCNLHAEEWSKLSGTKLLLYTDLEHQLALSNYKKCWIYEKSTLPNLRDINFHFELFYNSVKDASWPECNSINHSKQLPKHIQQELLSHSDYSDFLNAKNWHQWFVTKNQANRINNDIVYSEVGAAAKHSDMIVKLQDIVNTNGTALLTPLGLPVTNQHIELIQKWKSLHSAEILAMMSSPVDSKQTIS